MATGFNGPPTNRSAQMPAPSKKLSVEEVELGKKLYDATKTYDGSPIQKLALAAKSLQYQNVEEVPARIKAYVLRMLKADTRRPQGSTGLTSNQIQEFEREWYKIVDPNTLHPEDEESLAEKIRKSREGA